jgi:hypothetical protein
MTSKLNLALIGYGEVGQVFCPPVSRCRRRGRRDLQYSRSGGGAGTDGESAQDRRAPGKACSRAAEMREPAMMLDDIDRDGWLLRAVAEAKQRGAAAEQDKES